MSAVDEHAEAHRLKDELGYGARLVAKELGISRYAAGRLLKRSLPAPVAEAAGVAEAVADEDRPVAEPVAEVADRPLTVVGHMADPAAEAADEVADGALVGPLLVVDLGRFPGLDEDLAVLQRTGATAEEAINFAVAALAQTYRNAVAAGRLRDGQTFDVVEMVLRAGRRPERRTA